MSCPEATFVERRYFSMKLLQGQKQVKGGIYRSIILFQMTRNAHRKNCGIGVPARRKNKSDKTNLLKHQTKSGKRDNKRSTKRSSHVPSVKKMPIDEIVRFESLAAASVPCADPGPV